MRLARDENVEVPLSSLIDIVFLLIIFFVVTSDMQKDVIDRQLKLAKSYNVPPLTDGPPPEAVTINLRKAGANDDGVKFIVAGRQFSERQIEALLQDAVRRSGDSVPVILRADGEVKYRHIQRINAIVGKVGLYRVSHAAEDQNF